MLSALSEAVSKAAEAGSGSGRFLSNQEFSTLSAIQDLASESKSRIDIVKRITSNAKVIVADSARSLFAEQPHLIAPGGNAYTSHKMAACLRDMEYILLYITYAMLVGDSSVLDDRCLNGLRETYSALGVPGASVARAVQNMKRLTLDLFADEQQNLSVLLAELASYFDRSAASVG
ncbi:hypothetical protein [Pseudanabaena sp. PCC 6802]|uniref:hypothetical protein n=1 Tax=Pseudanabaena sp. PCC 6802 TaxID=118173 RepID=UPI000348EF18|nr:hypothetical protein [Pseudanabaena sp. PCC 6802]